VCDQPKRLVVALVSQGQGDQPAFLHRCGQRWGLLEQVFKLAGLLGRGGSPHWSSGEGRSAAMCAEGDSRVRPLVSLLALVWSLAVISVTF
jgi:hypothetical protein